MKGRRHFQRVVNICVFLIAVAVASPAFAVDNAAECYECRPLYYENGSWYYYCGDPDNNDWGYSECDLGLAGCTAQGDLCYYIEVRPR
ncbi:MAG TPA: hypothetical protein VF846_16545 [Thermoanaerobaculia bacterium]|jgi:hypothetical protein